MNDIAKKYGRPETVQLVGMKITNDVPDSWKDLQDKVCEYLNQVGYKAETTKTIKQVRGKVEVDVFATSDDEMLRQFVCECKYWDTPVPQEKVHAFRTVVHDSGSMLGILIAKSSFQKGAIEAAYCSNVILKDWDGFIEMIAAKWLKHRLNHLIEIAFPLSIYTDPLDVDESIFDNKEDALKYKELQDKYMESYIVGKSLELGRFDKDVVLLDGRMFEDFNSLFDYLEDVYARAIREYEALFADYKKDEWKFDRSNYMRIEPSVANFMK